jgi:hypothetical protein
MDLCVCVAGLLVQHNIPVVAGILALVEDTLAVEGLEMVTVVVAALQIQSVDPHAAHTVFQVLLVVVRGEVLPLVALEVLAPGCSSCFPREVVVLSSTRLRLTEQF